MKYIKPVILGLFLAIFSILIPPFLVPFLLPFIKWDSTPTPGGDGGTASVTIRGDLPKWLSWFSTPDERLPGDITQPAVGSCLKKFGKNFCAYYWIGQRNRAVGLATWLGQPTNEYIPSGTGYWENGDIWRYAMNIGPLQFICGYQVYKLLDGTFHAAPCVTIKKL